MVKQAKTRIDAGRLFQDLAALSQFGALASGGITRPAYSEAYRQAQDWLIQQMKEAGLSTHVDGAGNIIGRLGALTGPTLVCGSHIDTVPDGGAYDGALGVLAGLAVARALAERADALAVAFEVVAFMDEEGAVYSETGARAMMGSLDLEDMRRTLASDGRPVLDHIEAFGLHPAGLASAQRTPGDVVAYLELHIEQGPILEAEEIEIGVVENIVGLHTSELVFSGQANHAGTTPAGLRRDAGRAAAESVTACFERIEECFPDDVRLTFGRMEFQPGASNVVPSLARLTREIRADSEALIESIAEETSEIAKSIARNHNVTLEVNVLSRDAPAAMSGEIVETIENICKRKKISYLRLNSGAGHDAQILAPHCPAGLIFVPSRGGISHNPAEFTEPAHIQTGAEVLLASVLALLQAHTRPE